jgi:hypothetical protein
MDAARIMLTANPGYDPNLMEHGMLTSLWRLHTYITTELTVTVQGTLADCHSRLFVLRILLCPDNVVFY